MRKAISPIVSVVILVVISISLAAMIASWMYDIVTSTTNQTQQDAQMQLKCRKAGLDFDSGYGNSGVLWNFTGSGSDWLKAKVVNTGSVDLHGFSFELSLNSQSGEEIRMYEATGTTAFTASAPLRPSASAVIEANLTDDINGSNTTLREVRVLNRVCVGISPSLPV